MNDKKEEEKRYTVLEVEKYRSNADELDIRIEKDKLWLSGCIALILIINPYIEESIGYLPQLTDIIQYALEFSGLFGAVQFSHKIIKNTVKQSQLESMADYLESETTPKELVDKENSNCKGPSL